MCFMSAYPHTSLYISHTILMLFIITSLVLTTSPMHMICFCGLWQQEGEPESGFLLTTTANNAQALSADVHQLLLLLPLPGRAYKY